MPYRSPWDPSAPGFNPDAVRRGQESNIGLGIGLASDNPSPPPGPSIPRTPPDPAAQRDKYDAFYGTGDDGEDGGRPSGFGSGLFSPAFQGNRNLSFDFGDAPEFDWTRFQAPTHEGIFSDPGYVFRRDEALGAMENSAFARGAGRSGQSVYDLGSLASGFASQETGNIWNRAGDAFDRQYRGEYDAWQGLFSEWQTNAAGTQTAGLASFDLALQEYLARLRADTSISTAAIGSEGQG